MAKKTSAAAVKMLAATGYTVDPSAFGGKGEVLAGLDILKLNVGEVGGPFVLKKILPQQSLGGGKGKKIKPVDVYVADFNGREIRMPIAASFVGKAKDAKLAVGDTFLVRRDADYTSKEYGNRECKSYSLNITTRK